MSIKSLLSTTLKSFIILLFYYFILFYFLYFLPLYYLIMFCMEFILYEILKYKLNILHVLIFLHIVCFYFECYSSILVGAVGLSQYYASAVQCRGFRKLGGGGGGGGSGNFRNFKGGGVEEFSGSRGDEDLWGLAKFQDLGVDFVGQ